MTKLVGVASIIDMSTQSPVVAQLYEEKESNQFRTYKMVYNEKEIGHVRFKHIKISEAGINKSLYQTTHKVKLGLQGENYPFYGHPKDDKIVNKLYVEWISSSKGFNGIGKALIQAVFERSLSKCKGRVDLNAAEAFEFYYSQGFRSIDEETNQELEKAFNEAKEKGQSRCPSLLLSSSQMYLPEDQIVKWNEKISKNPILK
jgi:hypothetical protein